MEYSDEWLRLRKAENDYFTCQYNFMQNEEEMVNNLKRALTKAHDKETALRFLLEMQLKATLSILLLPEILDLAIDSTGLDGIRLAKEVVSIYKNEPQIKESIKSIVNSYLASNDEWHYRRIAELYKLLSYKEELTDFLLLCQANSNWEIQEIADDFLRADD